MYLNTEYSNTDGSVTNHPTSHSVTGLLYDERSLIGISSVWP